MTKQTIAVPAEIFVSPDGNDRWSGKLSAANRAKSDGPLATIQAAVRAARKLKVKGQHVAPVTITLRGGLHVLNKPLVLTDADSGTPAVTWKWETHAPEMPLLFRAFEGEEPVVSGGRAITGWREETLNGRKVWVARIPAVAAGKWSFRTLFVNGQRRLRPRLPREGSYRVAQIFGEPSPRAPWRPGADRFGYAQGDIKAWHNIQDVEFLAIHQWMETRARLKSVDEATQTAFLDRTSDMRLAETHLKPLGSPYWLENIFEEIQPGEWYLDKPTGRLYYMPLKGEKLAGVQIIAPALQELLRLRGDRANGQYVQQIRFEGITFAHTNYEMPSERASMNQSSNMLPGAVKLYHARQCAFVNCRFTGIEQFCLELLDGCQDVTIQGNLIEDNGGGGIKVWHLADTTATLQPGEIAFDACRRITIADNEIRDSGKTFLSAAAILIGRCSGNMVIHNHIHDMYQIGVSVGWTWGYGDENNAYGNIVEYNHIHDMGQGMLSDLGGVYMLGLSTGTRVRYNHIHDIISRGYGGWGIYNDEGSTDALIEFNLIHHCKSSCYHQHFGRDNLLHNNIFALSRDAQLQQTRGEDHMTLILRNNIFLYEGDLIGGVEGDFMMGNYSPSNITFENNLYWQIDGKPVKLLGRSMRQWQKMGFDRGSVAADPKFADPQGGDFALAADSPAFKTGFVPFDVSGAGVRKQFAYRR